MEINGNELELNQVRSAENQLDQQDGVIKEEAIIQNQPAEQEGQNIAEEGIVQDQPAAQEGENNEAGNVDSDDEPLEERNHEVELKVESKNGVKIANLKIMDVGAYFSETMLNIARDRKYTDLTIKCSDGDVPAHRAMLCSFSPYFKTMFHGNENTECISFPNIDAVTMRSTLHLIYIGLALYEGEFLSFRPIADGFHLLGFDRNELEERAPISFSITPVVIEYV